MVIFASLLQIGKIRLYGNSPASVTTAAKFKPYLLANP
jgi:hypothetical protein